MVRLGKECPGRAPAATTEIRRLREGRNPRTAVWVGQPLPAEGPPEGGAGGGAPSLGRAGSPGRR
eukprot:8207565-Lingulodinium_polyedra.AAC.1